MAGKLLVQIFMSLSSWSFDLKYLQGKLLVWQVPIFFYRWFGNRLINISVHLCVLKPGWLTSLSEWHLVVFPFTKQLFSYFPGYFHKNHGLNAPIFFLTMIHFLNRLPFSFVCSHTEVWFNCVFLKKIFTDSAPGEDFEHFNFLWPHNNTQKQFPYAWLFCSRLTGTKESSERKLDLIMVNLYLERVMFKDFFLG